LAGYEVQHDVVSEAGRTVGGLSKELGPIGTGIQKGVQESFGGVPGFAVAGALEGYAQQAQAALRTVGTALEDHGGGLVNSANNYDNTDREMRWMFKRYESKLNG
jgi:hypothetical protein